jgi:DNA repair exonuclease SbcCD nuclease subunit
LREDTPICRTDNFQEAQWDKVRFIKELQQKHDCIVLHGGDLFDHWKTSPYLLSKTVEHLPDCFYSDYGNHDLPQHNFELYNKSGLHVLHATQQLFAPNYIHFPKHKWEFNFWHFGVSPNIELKDTNALHILVWHTMTYTNDMPYPGCPDLPAIKLLKKYPEYQLILTGDNHQTFVEGYKGRLLVNPGSLTRQDASQINHKPCVFLWFAESNTVQPVYLPIRKDVVSREHIEATEQRCGRIDAFISSLNNEYSTTISFDKNLEQFFKHNKIRESVQQIIIKSIGK